MDKPKEQVVHVEYDVAYLPTPNTVEVVITNDLAPAELTKTAFMVPVCDDGGIIIAVNQRRGLEIAGGSAPVKIFDMQDRRITRKSITLFGNAALKSVLGYIG